MAFVASELPANNAVACTSLFHTNETAEKDEWLGELHLQEAVAFLLLQRTSNSEDIASLKENHLQECSAFRHDSLCDYLRSKGVRQYQPSEPGVFQGTINFKEKSLGWIGAIRRRGTPEEQQILQLAIVASSGSYDLTPSSESEVTNPIQPGDTAYERSSDEDSVSTDSDSETWRYTKVLQEQFAGKSAVPVYQGSTLRWYPPKFGSEVTYRGQTFSAQAGNKKLAKHRSSKKLCKHLGIKVAGI